MQASITRETNARGEEEKKLTVDPDRPGLQSLGDVERVGDIATEYSRRESVDGVVGLGDNVVVVLREKRKLT